MSSPLDSTSIATRAREAADHIDSLGQKVVASFRLKIATQRAQELREVQNEIVVGMIPVISWLERRRPADTADLVKRRMDYVLREAVQCAALDIPEYAGGTIAHITGEPSKGAQRTATLVASAMVLAGSLRDWAGEIEARTGHRSDLAEARNEPIASPVKPKRSTERGEGRRKLIAALPTHHEYADGGCLNLEPIGNNELARLAKVATATAKRFFDHWFGGHATYRGLCRRNPSKLVDTIKSMRGEFVPSNEPNYGAVPPAERERD